MSCLSIPSRAINLGSNKCTTEKEWDDIGTCEFYISSLVYDNNFESYNPKNIAEVNDIMYSALIDTQTGNQTIQFNDTFKKILETCKNVPLACDNFLNETCSPCKESDLLNSQDRLELCGCYTSTDFNKPIDKCSATCNLPETIKRDIDIITGNVNKCVQTVCVIDNIKIQSAKTIGNIDIDQLCTGCEDGGCICILDLDDDTENLQDKIQYSNNCNKMICYLNGKETPCQAQTTVYSRNYLFPILILMLCSLFFFLINYIQVSV